MTEENWLLYEVLPISVQEGELPKLKRWGGPFESRDFAVRISQSAGKKFPVHGWAVAPMREAQHRSYGPTPGNRTDGGLAHGGTGDGAGFLQA